MVKSGLENIFEIPPCAHHVIFITEFILLIKTPLFYEVISFNRKWLAPFFVTYSILTGQTKVEFVIYWVLILLVILKKS